LSFEFDGSIDNDVYCYDDLNAIHSLIGFNFTVEQARTFVVLIGISALVDLIQLEIVFPIFLCTRLEIICFICKEDSKQE